MIFPRRRQLESIWSVFAGDAAAQHAFDEHARVHYPRAVHLANGCYTHLHIDVPVSLAGGQSVVRGIAVVNNTRYGPVQILTQDPG